MAPIWPLEKHNSLKSLEILAGEFLGVCHLVPSGAIWCHLRRSLGGSRGRLPLVSDASSSCKPYCEPGLGFGQLGTGILAGYHITSRITSRILSAVLRRDNASGPGAVGRRSIADRMR
jgi:hypothetical protein